MHATKDNTTRLIADTIRRDQHLGETMAFHAAFDQGIPPCPCVSTNADKIDLYAHKLMQEELSELHDELEDDNEVGVLDALCDLQVILDGLWVQTGMHVVKQEAMMEVHESNMSKLGEDGKPIYREDGKIMKGPNYFKPNLKKILKEWRERNERT
jgi:hypothetical protein